MSEEKKIYCTECGSENDASFKFCSSCGAKLVQADGKEEPKRNEGVFSSEVTVPVYEKITDAEEEKPASGSYGKEIEINYGSDQQNYYSGNTGGNTYYDPGQPQYYSTDPVKENKGGGNIGVAIASLICGILSLVCCCLGLFSAILAVAAIVLGIITLCFKYDGKGMAIAGIATGGCALAILIVAMIISGTSLYSDLLYEFMDEFYY